MGHASSWRTPATRLDSHELDPDVAKVVVKEIESAGGVALASTVDVSTPTAGAQLVSEALNAFGRLDILINNAGAFHEAVFEEIDERTFADDWTVHVIATVRTTAAAFPVMASQGGGTILNTGSSFWAPRSPGFASYSPAKGAIFSFTRSAAAEGASSHIRVNTLIPLAITACLTEVAQCGRVVRSGAVRGVAPAIASLELHPRPWPCFSSE